MPRRDPLGVLARIRGMQRDAARRNVAEARFAVSAAEAVMQREAVALAAEAAIAEPADYAAWLPASMRARESGGLALRQADARAELARAALVAARADAEAVEQLLAARRKARRQARLAAQQRVLDDLRRDG